jgi:hypothetical protein
MSKTRTNGSLGQPHVKLDSNDVTGHQGASRSSGPTRHKQGETIGGPGTGRGSSPDMSAMTSQKREPGIGVHGASPQEDLGDVSDHDRHIGDPDPTGAGALS